MPFKTINVDVNKNKTLVVLFAGLLLLCLCVWLLFNLPAYSFFTNTAFNNSFVGFLWFCFRFALVFSAGFLGVVFSIISIFCSFSLIIKKNPLLEVSTKGILDKSNCTSEIFINWDNIRSFEGVSINMLPIHKSDYIIVKIKSSQKLIRHKGLFSKDSFIFINRSRGTKSIWLNTYFYKINQEELLKLLNENLEILSKN